MKKFLSLLLSLLMLTSMVAGCSGNAEADNPENTDNPEENITEQTLEIVIYDRGEDEDYWNAVVSAFEENNPGVKVDMFIDEDAAYELRNRILGGASPDFVFLPTSEESGITDALIKDRALLPLSDIAQTAEPLLLPGVFDNAISKPYGDDKIYLAPLFFDTEGFIYNKTLLNENEWKLPENWDQFVELADECDKKKISIFAYAGKEPEEFSSIFASAVGSLVGTEKLSQMFECEAEAWEDDSVNTFAGYIDKIKKLVANGSTKKTKDDAKTSLKNGEALFISGNLRDMAELVSDDDETSVNEYGFIPYPAIDAQNKVNVIDFSEMFIPLEAKNPDLAKKFLVFQYSDIAVKIAADNLGESAPVLKITNTDYGFDDAHKEVYNSLGSGKVFVPKFKIKAAENESLEDEFCNLVISVFKESVSAEDFASTMKDYLEDY